VKPDAFRYDGKRAVVVGGATGMGAATAQLVQDLGADVIVMDYAPVTFDVGASVQLDLRDTQSIDAAVDGAGDRIDALFSCAGVADGTPGIERVNFIGHRHFIDQALEKGLLGRGSAIGMISSAAGLGWETDLELLKEYLDTPDFDTAVKWIEAHPDKADYMWSKETLCAYVAREAVNMLKRGIRINAILPGPTDTPLAQANAEVWLGFGADYREATGIEPSRPDEQAAVLAFLCCDAASYVNGQTVITDAGYVAAGVTGEWDSAKQVVDFFRGGHVATS